MALNFSVLRFFERRISTVHVYKILISYIKLFDVTISRLVLKAVQIVPCFSISSKSQISYFIHSLAILKPIKLKKTEKRSKTEKKREKARSLLLPN